MTTEAIRAFLRNVPFQPFTLRLADGRAIGVPHPDFAHVATRRLIFIHPSDPDSDDEKFDLINTALIVSVSPGLPESAPAPV